MALQIQLLKDVPDTVDHAPLLDFCQLVRENGDMNFYIRYDNCDTGSSIVDLSDVLDCLNEYYDTVNFTDTLPPDIRDYCKQQIDLGHTLAWISW